MYHDNLPVVPNFFLAAKRPNGPASVAIRQASYGGALRARGMHSLRSYGQPRRERHGSQQTIDESAQIGMPPSELGRVSIVSGTSSNRHEEHQGGWISMDIQTWRPQS
ncbi:hypothetical protein BGW36DRAFT_373042 [Talaromyces proteolyticus]|uniref:Uncharacterized protein n=1 Tax=Talaromyces proteolyticus TaxID=1131652 RepID=A0AAD4L2A9_9EURO|nr:uncharacterized protein BGW36DRAFT_373042 [Talaromyces proteolyticus]KAH8702540.1 hypothetical protein BGW36DRAFT_373042 [Talaromyces proteolyticus]